MTNFEGLGNPGEVQKKDFFSVCVGKGGGGGGRKLRVWGATD